MINNQILDYIQKSIEGGYEVDQIKAALLQNGWKIENIEEALTRAQEIINLKLSAPIAPIAPLASRQSEWAIELKSLSASQILLYLGGLIVILAGVTYVSINWSQWGVVARIFAILLPMLICYGVGTSMWVLNQHKKQGIIFLVVGSLLFPFFLFVLFKELELFAEPFNSNFNFTVSLSSFLLYLICNYFFRFPIWSFLYQGVGLFVFYYFLRLIGVESFSEDTSMAWLLLIPGTLYLFLSLFYENIKQKESAYYSQLIGALVIVISFLRLFEKAIIYNKDYWSWILLTFGIFYFIIGVLFEKNNYKKYSHAPYFIGVAIIFLSFLRLGLTGSLLEDLIGTTTTNNQNIVGWSSIIVGLLYLVFAYIIEKLRNIGIEDALKYKNFFNFVGPSLVLSAIFYLGTDGNKYVYETMLLLASLGFIFGSIPKLTKQYLLVGTLFLIVYIFSIGGEYFQNEVGWPITLFVAGLASMGISILIEKVRRKYFVATKV